MVDKVKRGFKSVGLLLLVLTSVALVPAVSTTSTYASSLKSATVKPSTQTAPAPKKAKTPTNVPKIISESIKGVKISEQDLDEPLDDEEDSNIGNSANGESVMLEKAEEYINGNKNIKQDKMRKFGRF